MYQFNILLSSLSESSPYKAIYTKYVQLHSTSLEGIWYFPLCFSLTACSLITVFIFQSRSPLKWLALKSRQIRHCCWAFNFPAEPAPDKISCLLVLKGNQGGLPSYSILSQTVKKKENNKRNLPYIY